MGEPGIQAEPEPTLFDRLITPLVPESSIPGPTNLWRHFTAPVDVIGGSAAGVVPKLVRAGKFGISNAARTLAGLSNAPYVALGAEDVVGGIAEADPMQTASGLMQALLGSAGAKEAFVRGFDPRAVVDAYARSRRRPVSSPAGGTVDEARARQIADRYAAGGYTGPEVPIGYGRMFDEMADQTRFLEDQAGLTIEPWTGSGQPYGSSKEMVADLSDRSHHYYYPTASGFGETSGVIDPTMAAFQTGSRPTRLRNDDLRIAHDLMAHAPGRHQFGPIGEERAWIEHMNLLPANTPSDDWMRQALTNETRGQNSWFNFGPHLRRPDGSLPQRGDPDWIHPADRPFADQVMQFLGGDLHAQ